MFIFFIIHLFLPVRSAISAIKAEASEINFKRIEEGGDWRLIEILDFYGK